MRRRRSVVLALLLLTALAVAGGAGAYLSSQGAGASTGSTDITLGQLTITSATATQGLLPTGTASGDVNVVVHNGNAGPVHVNSIALDSSEGSSGFSANAAGCQLSFSTQTNGGDGWTIGADSSLSVDLTDSVTMGTGAASSCQGQSFTVYLETS